MTPGRCLACLASVSLAAGLAATSRLEARAIPGPTAPMTVEMLLTTAPDLPARARAAMVAEATQIWAREDVVLKWPPAGTIPDEDAPRLRVLVLHRDVGEDGHWPVGELLRTGADGSIPAPPGYAVAVISIPGARRVLAAARRFADRASNVELQLGVVLGRAVAHELGHYLLATATHAPNGLMRARIDAADFSDLRVGGFFLDREARRWMQRHASLAEAPRFSYRED